MSVLECSQHTSVVSMHLKTHNKRISHFQEFVANAPADSMQNTSVMGMQRINDRTSKNPR